MKYAILNQSQNILWKCIGFHKIFATQVFGSDRERETLQAVGNLGSSPALPKFGVIWDENLWLNQAQQGAESWSSASVVSTLPPSTEHDTHTPTNFKTWKVAVKWDCHPPVSSNYNHCFWVSLTALAEASFPKCREF